VSVNRQRRERSETFADKSAGPITPSAPFWSSVLGLRRVPFSGWWAWVPFLVELGLGFPFRLAGLGSRPRPTIPWGLKGRSAPRGHKAL
jgi:hypothetical protein